MPLVLVDLHADLSRYLVEKPKQKEYWKHPEVWRDIKASFEKFFELSPDAIGFRHNYARYAYWCEQWDDLKKQMPLLGEVNYAFFGGKAEFERMAALAENRGRKN